jgi:hypothetical protein
MANKSAKPGVLIIAVILSLTLTFGSQFLSPNKFTPSKEQLCVGTAENPECPTTLPTTIEKGFPFAYKTLRYDTDANSPNPDTAIKTNQSNTFSLNAFGWSCMFWFGLILIVLTLWRKRLMSNIIQDPVVLVLSAILLTLLITYQLAGGGNSDSVLLRDFINVFQYGLLVLFSYLLIRPILSRSLAKSTTTQSKIGKTALGILGAMVIALAVVYVLISLAFSLAFSNG